MMKKRLLTGATLLAAMAFAHTAAAQRAQENATTSADDAFGTQVGSESVGLYDMNKARGFSPQLAGNIRVEGLYIDVQGMFGIRLVKDVSMRIGLTAQSYPFPAPTGIADISLIQPADHTVVSAQYQYQNAFGFAMETVDISTPLIGDKLSMAGGINNITNYGDAHTSGRNFTFADSLRWRPTDNLEIIPFIYNTNAFRAETAPSVFIGGNALPPQFDRNVFYGEPWAAKRMDDQNYGVIVRGTPWQNWRLQAGLFHTKERRIENDVVFFRNVQPNGTGTLDILRYPEQFSGSYSGEVRASGVFTDGSFRHTIHFGVHGRDTVRRFGGGDDQSFGPATVGVFTPHGEPTFNFGVRDQDVVKQYTPGVSYVGQWARVGEFSVGLQKSFYHREFGKIGAATTTTTAQPWLYNGTLSVNPLADLTLYSGYTRGIEEFGVAPDNAANGGAPLPAKVTKQIDAGLRYRIMPGVNLLAGVFEVSKPFFERDTANVYTNVGSLRHRGIETSLSGKVIDNVTIVAGAVFLQPRVSGLPVVQGTLGRVPVGTPLHLMRLSVQYDLPQVKGLSLDTQLESIGALYADRRDTVKAPAANTVTVGMRYGFSVYGTNAYIRAQVFNLTNDYAWTGDPSSGRITPTQPRRYLVRLAADF